MVSSSRAEHLTRLLSSAGAASVTLYINILFLQVIVDLKRDNSCKLVLWSGASCRVVCISDFTICSRVMNASKTRDHREVGPLFHQVAESGKLRFGRIH